MLTFDNKGGWGGQKNPKTCLRNTWMFPCQKNKCFTSLTLYGTRVHGNVLNLDL